MPEGTAHGAPAALPSAYLVHRTPTRLRLRIPERRGDRFFFAAAQEHLGTLEGVSALCATPATGSILVQHGPDLRLTELEEQARRTGLFALAGVAPREPPLAEQLARRFAALDAAVRRSTGGAEDGASLLLLGLLVAALVQLARGNVAVPALTATWYALHLTLMARTDPAAPKEPAVQGGEPGPR